MKSPVLYPELLEEVRENLLNFVKGHEHTLRIMDDEEAKIHKMKEIG